MLHSATVELAAVAHVQHWLDLDAFYAEVHRVLVPRGVLAVWSYGDPVLPGHPKADRMLQRFNHETVGPYWPGERHAVGEGYRAYPFPFDEVAVPEMTLDAEWTLAQLAGYVRSWSATSRYVERFDHQRVRGCLVSVREAGGGGPTHTPDRRGAEEAPHGPQAAGRDGELLRTRARHLRTTNAIEHDHADVRRRTRVVRTFPNAASVVRLTTALAVERNEQWLERCYLPIAPMNEENPAAEGMLSRPA